MPPFKFSSTASKVKARYISPYKHAVVIEGIAHVVTKVRVRNESRLAFSLEDGITLICASDRDLSVVLIDDDPDPSDPQESRNARLVVEPEDSPRTRWVGYSTDYWPDDEEVAEAV